MRLAPRILVTGFSIFDNYLYNPTSQIVEDINGAIVNGIVVEGMVLPVSFKRVVSILRTVLEERRPAIVVGLGFAPRASKVVVEIASTNIAYFQAPDVDGYLAEGIEIESGGKLVVETSIPLKDVVEYCTKTLRLPVVPGMSIGTYLCNTAAYIIMSYAERRNAIGGFLHIPPTTDVSMRLRLPSSLPYREVLDAVLCVLRVCVDYARRKGVVQP